ncbi:hypothetical protein D1007_43541 [Hordeum vulgare]|nr:hypothetical protein D1007_43541 [Hordeum vulgare]
MRLRTGFTNNLTVMGHAFICKKLFKSYMRPRLPHGVVPLCKNSALTSLVEVMPECNAHGMVVTWIEPREEDVLSFFDCLSEKLIREEAGLVRETIDEEVAYIASRTEERAHAKAAESVNFYNEGAPDEEALQDEELVGEPSSSATEGPSKGRAPDT